MSESNSKPVREIGFSKPPIETRFPKGVSGNPTGRPKGTPNLSTLLRRGLQEKTVKSNGGVRKGTTAGEAIVEKLISMARSGDIGAIRLVFILEAKLEDSSCDMPKKLFNNSHHLLEENGSTASDSMGYVVPDPILARRTFALLQHQYGVKIDGKDPILVITNERSEEFALKISKIYGFALSAKEALRLVNDGILVKESDPKTRKLP